MFDQQGRYEQILFQSLGKEIKISQTQLIAAGNLNQGVHLKTSLGEFFLKYNFEQRRDIFEKEAAGLELIRLHSPLFVPEVFHQGVFEDYNYLLMDWLPAASLKNDYWELLGHGLAQMHMTTQSNFGLNTDNYIASLEQYNLTNDTWSDFFIKQRLDPLIGKAYYEGLVDKSFLDRFKLIYVKLSDYFPKERPALLHGDLWSGNVLPNGMGSPALIDPAVYFGHREVDLAFSKMFGGFDQRFYDAYEEVFPLENDFESRIDIYNLYPLLVHLLLFGKSYLPGIKKTVDRLLG
jgi:fructosamine-3-kinase